jgi:glucose-1-phosphate thymidylyltransferase
MMKGVILAGGTGSRLFPSTKVVNKHLLPVFNKPMIYYPIETLKNSGIDDILVITSRDHIGSFMQLLGSGSEFGVNFTFRIQEGSGGIAQALSLAEDFAKGESLAVILSDNIFEEDFSEDVLYFTEGAKIFVKEVDDPHRFGVVEMDENGLVKSIEEKPALPKSNFVQTGFAVYDKRVFDIIRTLNPSQRGELEITDVNNTYLKEKKLSASLIHGAWLDAGTHESLLEGGVLLQELLNNPQKRKERLKLQTSQHLPKVTVGLVTHNSEKYIQYCLQSLLQQEYKNFEVVVFDNNSDDYTIDLIHEHFPRVRVLESLENVGFAKAHNEIIRSTEGEYYACLNVDMIFEQNFLSKLVQAIQQKPIMGSSGGKIKRWDFEAMHTNMEKDEELGKTNFIDSAGIRILKSHRFEDIGQNEVDYGQYEESKMVFGISGAAVLYRRKALDDVAFVREDGEKEYFDESMFMYKEDLDLAYRLQWAGWKSYYTPHAVCYHDRSVAIIGNSPFDVIRNRSKKGNRVNRLSYLNHNILLKKNFSDSYSFDVRKSTGWYNAKVFLYLLVFETELLSEWWKFFRMRKSIQKKRNSIPRRVKNTDIEKLMEI